MNLCNSFFPFGIEGELWDLFVLISDHCLSVYYSVWDIIRLDPDY